MKRFLSAICLLGALLSSCKQTPFEEEATAKKINTVKRKDVSDAQWTRIWAGKAVYETYCSGCHGMKGDGKGPGAAIAEAADRKRRHPTSSAARWQNAHPELRAAG